LLCLLHSVYEVNCSIWAVNSVAFFDERVTSAARFHL
jgi:hypothetical protein